MKQILMTWILAAVISLVMVSGLVMAEAAERYPVENPSGNIIEIPQEAMDNAHARWIIPLEYSTDREKLEEMGCKIVHELNDALAVKCPKGVMPTGAIEDKILHVTDMDANVLISADDVWAMDPSITGDGVTVAVLDSGVDKDNPELISSIIGGKGFGYADYEDDHGHGTHVSGIITSDGLVDGYSKGASPNTKIWMAKVCNSAGSCYTSDMAAAIDYVVNNNVARIMSISIGGGGTTQANCDRDYLANKVNWAVSKGVTAVIAAGNDGARVSSPGCASKAIAVGAVSKTDIRASFSGIGLALDIMAPGVSIYSTLPGGTYESWSGTSMATPHISAVVALIRQKHPDWTDSQVKDALYKTAKDLGTAGWDKYYGWGRVEAYKAATFEPTSEPPACTPNRNCNCNNVCDKKESSTSCPWDCPA